MSEKIIENNKLIAEFMGWKTHPIYGEGYLINKDRNRKVPYWSGVAYQNSIDSFEYEFSWDWLFPVLEKINSCGCIIEISMCFNIDCRICVIGDKQEKTINIYSELNGIDGAYDCVIQFIKYYNEKNNK